MGCGMSRSNLMDDFGTRGPFHHNTPKLLLMNYGSSSEPVQIVHQPPVLQKINTTHRDDDGSRMISNSKVDHPMWVGSPSFREYIQSDPSHVASTTGDDERRVEAVDGTHGGEHFNCNREVCVWGDSKGKTHSEDRKDARGGRFRKVFQVHRVSFWPGGAWHAGHPKATTKSAEV